MSKPRIHAVIISWQGQAEAARAIADAVHPHVDGLSVIYSNAQGSAEMGPGEWISVPQSWYYGRKFGRSLSCPAPSEIMLQIQADAAYDDWGALVSDCRASFDQHDLMGIWAAELDWTPWPTERVSDGSPPSEGLVPVQQTDGVVWALHPQVWQQMAQYDYQRANLGWGIDWIALYFSRKQNRYCVRDQRHVVHHPKGRGYSNAVATQHMKNLLAQLDIEARNEILSLHAKLHVASGHDKRQDNAKLPNQATVVSGKLYKMLHSSLTKSSPLSRACIFDGHVYVATDRPIGDLALACGEERVGLTKMDGAPPSHISPATISLSTKPLEDVEIRENELDDWQVPGWPTLRIIPDRNVAQGPIALGSPTQLDPGDGVTIVHVALARHRASGLITLTLTDKKSGKERVLSTPFKHGFAGGNKPEGYQIARFDLGKIANPTTLQLGLIYEGTDETSSEPPVFFVARPQVSVCNPDLPMMAQVLQLGHADENLWYEGAVDSAVRHSHDPLILEGAGHLIPLLGGHDATLTCEQEWGHAFKFRSSVAMSVLVYINGAPAFETVLNEGVTFVHLPEPHLTGRHSWIDFRDISGTRSYWSDWVLPRWQVTPTETLQAEGKGPYPTDVFHQSPYRFRALREHIANGANPALLSQLPDAIAALEAGHERLKLSPLTFPKVKSPDVSVVVPAHNKVKVTYACLASLLLAPNKTSFEVILVDDGSSDETSEIKSIVSGIKVVRNKQSQHFIRACNSGVKASKGRFVVLLNNDTEVTSGWLDALVDAFDRFDNVGLVGSKLLYPNGKLQDAGGIIWGSGDPWNYGNGHSPWDPRFCYARQADYLSGAAMMTTRDIWDQVGGLSSYLEPMYFEDTDFAFKVRSAGYTTWFVPSSIVYHYEGMTSGTDTSTGFKRYQEVNRPKFKRRWAKEFAGFTKTPSRQQADLEKDRGILGRVLFIDYTTPTPDMDAGSYAAVQEMKLVQSLGYKITFLPENLAYFGGYTEELGNMGVEVIRAPFCTNIDEFLQERGTEFDAFYITRYHVANANVPRIRAVNPEARIIMNNADLHYLRLLRKAVAEGDEAQKEAARRIQTNEFDAMKSVDLVLSYNDKEHAIIEALSEGEINVMHCPWVLECPETVAPLAKRKGLSFLGGFRHHPNVEGVEWFAKNVMNRLEAKRPDIKLSIYGSRMGPDIKALQTSVIDPVGFVEDVADAYDKHRIFVAPLLSGAGIKGKVLSALAHGIPCVLSPMAAEGIGLRHGQDCMIASNSSEWIEGIIALTDDDKLWKRVSEAGRTLAQTQFSFDYGREQMRKAFEAVEIFSHCS